MTDEEIVLELIKENNLPEFLYENDNEILIGWYGDSECGVEYKKWLLETVIPLIKNNLQSTE